MATAIESTRISRARTAAPSGFRPHERRRATGRAAGDADVPRSTRPLATSSPTRRADRAPGQTGRGDELGRETGRRVRGGSRTMTLRLARRTVSLRCPTSSRLDTQVLCSSLANVVTDCAPAARVKSAPRSAGARGGRPVGRVEDGTTRDERRVRWGDAVHGEHRPTKVIPGLRRSPRCEVVAIASREDERARAVARPSWGSRARTGRTRRSWPTPRSTPSTSRCPTTCTPSGRSPRRGPASTSCARSRSP